jgi:DNA repair photolyase
MPAFYDGWTPDTIRPADLSFVEAILKEATGEKEPRNRLARAVKNGVPIAFGGRSEPFLKDKDDTALRTFELLHDYGVDEVIINTQSSWEEVKKYYPILSEMKPGFNVSILEGGNPGKDSIARKLEPKSPSSRQRWELIEKLSQLDIYVAARLEPILPTINDTTKHFSEYAIWCTKTGAKHVSFYNYHVSRRPMAKALIESAGYNYETMMKFNTDQHWVKIADRAFRIFERNVIPSSTGDWVHFGMRNACESCCGTDLFIENGYHHLTFQHALRIIKEKGRVKLGDVLKSAKIFATKQQIEEYTSLWNDRHKTYLGMADVYDTLLIDLDGEDSDGNRIWKRGKEEKGKTLEDYF